jgi:tRNA(Ile)-lysidine synthase
VQLVRPLLGFSKQRLIATLATRDVPWIDDPTNSNGALERTRVREALAASGLAAPALAMTARRMRDAADGLAFAEAAFEKTLQMSIDRGIYARFDRRAFDGAPAILRQMVLNRLIGIFGGATVRPERSEIEALALRFTGGTQWSATLGGVMISAGSRFVRLWREPGRISAAPVMLTSGELLLWDDRYRVGFDGGADTAINVAPLGRAAYQTMAGELAGRHDLPAGAAYGLPAFFSGTTLLSVPLLGPQLGMTTSKREDFKALRFWCDSIHHSNTD